MEKPTKNKVIGLLIFGFFVLLSMNSTNHDSKEKTIESRTVSYSVSAKEIFHEYKDNEVAADNKYKGQVVVVFGQIDSIGKDILDQAYVALGTGELIGSVQCFFDKNKEKSVAQLHKGQSLSIKGVVTGKMGNVLLKHCVF